MHVGFIGDLHIDYNIHHDFLSATARMCERLALDRLVLCGDTTTGVWETMRFIEALSARVSTTILQIPGNHELYCLGKGLAPGEVCMTANETMDFLLNDATSLFRNPIVSGEWVIIGGPSWYDYSLHRHYLRMDTKAKSRFLRRNPEYKYIEGSETNPYINEKITAKSLVLLERQLRTIRERPGGAELKICSVIHMLPIKEMYKSSHIWGTTVAFMGSKYYAELYETYGVDRCICAHSHIRRQMTKNGTEYINVSLGHNFKWTHKTNLFEELLATTYVMDI